LLLSEAAPSNDGSGSSAERRWAHGGRTLTGYTGPRRKLLLVDDDPSHIDIVQSLLAPLDFILVTARDGVSGLSLAEKHRPDLTMVDLTMPGMTGWQVAEAMRAMPQVRGMKIVIVSANAHEFSPGGADADHDAFLIKPIDMQQVLECLAGQLNLQWTFESGAGVPPARESDLPSALPDHSRHHVDDLYQLGLIGHVRGIQAKLREMESDPTNKPFASRMRTLVANFDLKRYMNVLEGMRKHG
jgi:CheY-like chemotaxis protein